MRALEVGPDYEGVPMTRRILEASRGVVVHSRFMRGRNARGRIYAVRWRGFRTARGFREADRNGLRHRLGLDEATPLIGVFGFLKPYKRIAESLRAFRRLLRVEPNVENDSGGRAAPGVSGAGDDPLLGLSASVRVLGFAPIEEFTGYMAACDIVLNLRFPTVGESSGRLLRRWGWARR